MGRTDGVSGGREKPSQPKQQAAKRTAAAPKQQERLSTAALEQVTETVLAALAAKSKRKRRKHRSSKRRASSSSDSSSSSSTTSSEDDPDKPSTSSSKTAKKRGKGTSGGRKSSGGGSAETGVTSAITGDEMPKRPRAPPKKKCAQRSTPPPAKTTVASKDAAAACVTTRSTPGTWAQTGDYDTASAELRVLLSPQLGLLHAATQQEETAAKSPIVLDSDGEAATPGASARGTPQMSAPASTTRRKTRRGAERVAAAPKPLSFCGDVPLAHLPRSFVLPPALADKQELVAFTVLGETAADPDLALLSPGRTVLPDLDNLDGLINLSRLTQAERYSYAIYCVFCGQDEFRYVRRLISAAQWNPALRANVRLCMLVNARSRTDIFYLLLRAFDVDVLLSEKTPVDNFLTLVYNYLEVLFMQRWFLMRAGKLTYNDLIFYGQRAENFKKYARYVELFFVRPREFYTALDEILQPGGVSGQAVAGRVLAKFVESESNLKAWFAMQHRANIRASSSRRVEMDMIADASYNWIAQDDEDVEYLLSNFWRSYNDARSSNVAHWVDDYPAEQLLEPQEFSRLLHLCHAAIYRKIYTNKALSLSARRVGPHLSGEIKCGQFISVAGSDGAVADLAQRLGHLNIDKAVLELASAQAEQWQARFQFHKYNADDDTSTAVSLRLPIGNTNEFKEHLLSVVYTQVVAAQQAVVAQPSMRESADNVAAVEQTDSAALDDFSSLALDTALQSTSSSSAAPQPVALTAIAGQLAQSATLSITPTRLVSLTARETSMWTTRSLRHFWEQPPPSSRHDVKTMVFYDTASHSLPEMRSQLHQELANVVGSGVSGVDNDVATALLHEVAEAYSSVRPLDVVLTVADGYWQLSGDELDHYAPVSLVDARKNSRLRSGGNGVVASAQLCDDTFRARIVAFDDCATQLHQLVVGEVYKFSGLEVRPMPKVTVVSPDQLQLHFTAHTEWEAEPSPLYADFPDVHAKPVDFNKLAQFSGTFQTADIFGIVLTVAPAQTMRSSKSGLTFTKQVIGLGNESGEAIQIVLWGANIASCAPELLHQIVAVTDTVVKSGQGDTSGRLSEIIDITASAWERGRKLLAFRQSDSFAGQTWNYLTADSLFQSAVNLKMLAVLDAAARDRRAHSSYDALVEIHTFATTPRPYKMCPTPGCKRSLAAPTCRVDVDTFKCSGCKVSCTSAQLNVGYCAEVFIGDCTYRGKALLFNENVASVVNQPLSEFKANQEANNAEYYAALQRPINKWFLMRLGFGNDRRLVANALRPVDDEEAVKLCEELMRKNAEGIDRVFEEKIE